MAVRVFELSDSAPQGQPVEAAPLHRSDVRRSRQRAATLCVIALSVPFLGVVILLGAGH
jgi:hypothetical protein